MEITLEDKIQYLKGVGPKLAGKLHKLGIEVVRDLVFYWPRRYEDYTHVTPIAQLNRDVSWSNGEPGQNYQTIRGKILGVANKLTSRQRMRITEVMVADETGTIKVVWFNQPFLKQYLKPGSEWILHGKVAYSTFTQELVMESPSRVRQPMIVPIYPETNGISSGYINKLVAGLKPVISSLEDFLPVEIKAKYQLLDLVSAVSQIHFPKDMETLEKARERLAFDELFLISLRAHIAKENRNYQKAKAITTSEDQVKGFVDSLPFELTGDQHKSSWQIIKDMQRDVPMNRLLNGDVGSGKTAVAAIASYAVIQSGGRVVVMAPTEVLATQHYESFQKLFGRFPKVSIGLLTANFKRVNNLGGPDAEKKLDKDRVLGAQIVIGTHALLQKNVEFEDLSLVIVDEQHRFGVAQRAALTGLMGSSSDKDLHKPHFLSMTATPIPRTLHLALFGDLDLSLIQEKPKNRKEIKTRYVEPHNRDKAYEFIRKQIQAGRQVFVICPLIEEKEDEDKVVTDLFGLDKKSVVKEYERLSKEIFPEFRVAMLHGKMKPKEKDEILVDYYAGKYHILVSTSVIEVGIDVPNASVMMIEDAERFGLAQIHQFRGRVGRGEHQSFCFLFSNTRSPLALRRLNSLESVADGFRLAEIDLETRGPGDMFGTLQSGQIELKMASFSDRILIEKASEAAARVIEEDRTLSQYSSLKQRFEVFEASKHFE